MTKRCTARMKSEAVPDHIHTCTGDHDEDGYHFCRRCLRWWWKAPKEKK